MYILYCIVKLRRPVSLYKINIENLQNRGSFIIKRSTPKAYQKPQKARFGSGHQRGNTKSLIKNYSIGNG